MFFGYKFRHKTKWLRVSDVDFVTGVTSWKNR